MIKKTLRSKLLRKIGQNALAVLCSFLLLQMGPASLLPKRNRS